MRNVKDMQIRKNKKGYTLTAPRFKEEKEEIYTHPISMEMRREFWKHNLCPITGHKAVKDSIQYTKSTDKSAGY